VGDRIFCVYFDFLYVFSVPLCLCACIYVYYLYVCMYMYICIYTHANIYVNKHIACMHVTYIVCIYIHCVYTYIYIYMLGTNILHIHITYILTRTLLPSHQNIQISMHICSPLCINARSCEYSLFVQVRVPTLWSKKN